MRCDGMVWYDMVCHIWILVFGSLVCLGWDGMGKCEIWRVRAYTPDPLSGITSEETRRVESGDRVR